MFVCKKRDVDLVLKCYSYARQTDPPLLSIELKSLSAFSRNNQGRHVTAIEKYYVLGVDVKL